jgi:hypothetical protein
LSIHLNLLKIQEMDSDYVLIEKEDVAKLRFPKEEVLKTEADKKNLNAALERANALGNLEHHKVKIYFEDDKKKKVVHTTIWAVTDNAIVLKQNVLIPIRRIYKLEI